MSESIVYSYPTLSISHFVALKEVLKRNVFRVSEAEEKAGQRGFDINPDGTWQYTDNANQTLMFNGKITLNSSDQAIQKAKEYLLKIVTANETSKELQQSLGTSTLRILSNYLRADRADREFTKQMEYTANGVEKYWFWRVSFVLFLKPDSATDPIPVKGSSVIVDLSWSGAILAISSNVPPHQEKPVQEKKFQLVDKTADSLTSLDISTLSLGSMEKSGSTSVSTPTTTTTPDYYILGKENYLPAKSSTSGDDVLLCRGGGEGGG
jgi:hypothetical protein